MFNPYDEKQMRRLHSAISWSRRQLSPFRETYRKLIQEFVTHHYHSEGGYDANSREVIVNLLGMAVEIHVMHLAPQTPKVLVSTDFREYSSVAYDFELALEKEFEALNLGKIMREVAMDAWFSVGILKLFLAEGNNVEVNGEMIDIGELRIASVSIDNWVHDCSARKFEECDFYGDLQRVRLDKLLASPHYENKDALRLNINDKSNSFGQNEFGEERAATLSNDGADNGESTMADYVEIWDIFLPKDQLLITIPKDCPLSHAPLRVVEWQGPKHGPYHMLQLNEVPENIMPSSPGMQLSSLHGLVNNLYRKLKDQAKRQKEVTMFKVGNEVDAKAVKNANDGDIIGVADPTAIGSVRYGGVDAQNHGFAVHASSLFDQQAGNLQMLGGLSPSADTLGQETILQQQSSVRTQKQKNLVFDVVKAVAKDIGWYRWHDVFFNPRIVKKVPGTTVQVVGSFMPADRIGRFIDFNFDIAPYSMEYQPPTAKLANLQGVLTNVILPMMPLMEQQGITVNTELLLKLIARYSNTPELLDAIIFANGEMSPSPQGKSIESVTRPPVTRRENVRINRSGGGVQAENEKVAQQLISSAPRPGVSYGQ